MKIVIVASLACLALASGSAIAADMPVKAPILKAPAPILSWTGCYLGGNVGGGWSHTDTNRVSQDTIGPAPAIYGIEDDHGFIGGGQVGCDYQVSPNWVIGVKGQFDFGNINGSHALVAFPTFSQTNTLKNIDTATGRIGLLVQPAVMLYLQAGGAWIRDQNTVLLPTGGVSETASFNLSGPVVGGGLEWMIVPNVSVFAEYNYIWFDTSAQHYIAPPTLFPPGEVLNFKQNVSTALVGVNWRFNLMGH
jgi:outer membrane immunogenic protein